MKLPLITLLDGEHSLHASLSILHSSRFPFNFSLFTFHKISSTSTNFSKFACKTTDLFGLFNISAIFFFYLSSTYVLLNLYLYSTNLIQVPQTVNNAYRRDNPTPRQYSHRGNGSLPSWERFIPTVGTSSPRLPLC